MIALNSPTSYTGHSGKVDNLNDRLSEVRRLAGDISKGAVDPIRSSVKTSFGVVDQYERNSIGIWVSPTIKDI